MKAFKAIQIGEKAELIHTITQRDIDKFVDLTGDNNKLHVDMEFAAKTSYKKPVAHGMLGASFVSTIIGTKLPGDGALWYSQNLEFLLPVRVGDTLTVIAEVIKKDKRTRSIELNTIIINQHKQKVLTGTAKVKIIEEQQEPQKIIKNKKRVALVIGGTGGIGQETCLQLAKDGFDVVVHYFKNSELAKKIRDRIIVQEKRAIVVQADITKFKQVQELTNNIIRQLGTITVVANCTSAKIPDIRFCDLEWNILQEHLDLNIRGAFNIHKCVLPIMEMEGYGKIIHLTTQAIEKPSPKWLHYITAKSALHGFTKAIAVELAPKGICVNLVSPGMTNTELIADIPEKARLLAEVQTPLKRLAEPDDIAGVISFLASKNSDYLTGETIRVNGGQIMI